MPSLPVVIVLAAGRGERFLASGGTVHKLNALLAEKPVIDHVLDAVRASGLPFYLVEADVLRPGMGDSIAAGVRANPEASGWMILPADLPLIRSETLRTIALAPPASVTVPMYGEQRGHPIRFGRACFQRLADLKGHSGAATVLRAEEAINSVAFIALDDIGTVTDVDTLEDLKRAHDLLISR